MEYLINSPIALQFEIYDQSFLEDAGGVRCVFRLNPKLLNQKLHKYTYLL